MNKISTLIIDDSEIDRYLLKRQLNDTGLDSDIFEVSNGVEALDFFHQREKDGSSEREGYPPTLIFLDINMPLLNGWGFLEKFTEIKSSFDVHSCVVMMFTSSNHKSDLDEMKKYDFVKGYLIKGSFTVDELREKIEQSIA